MLELGVLHVHRGVLLCSHYHMSSILVIVIYILFMKVNVILLARTIIQSFHLLLKLKTETCINKLVSPHIKS